MPCGSSPRAMPRSTKDTPPLTDNTSPADTAAADVPFDAAAAAADVAAYSLDRAYGSEAAPSRVTTANASGIRWTLTALEPSLRGDIPQRLAAIADPATRERAEHDMVSAVVRTLARDADMRRGHPNGSLYDQTVAEIVNETDRLEKEAYRLDAAISEVTGYDRTGTPKFALDEASRANHRYRQGEITRHIMAINGPEGERRLAEARDAEVEQRRVAHENAYIMREATRRAETLSLDARIDALAAAKAKLLPKGY